jgi:enterochelin esterase family protein
MKTVRLLAAVLVTVLAARALAAAEDAGNTLSSILVAGEDWQLAVDGLAFADGPSCDAEGNLYFSNMRATPAAIYKLSPDGKRTKVVEANMSGTKLGPDGRLYACGDGKVIAVELPSGKVTVLAENVQPNDLVVSHRGLVYITETKKQQVTLLDPKTRQPKAVDTGIAAPNGITLSPDQKTLLVSDSRGVNLYAFKIQDDGTLAGKTALATLKTPPSKPGASGGDGMAMDSTGRCYVSSAVGVQVVDSGGKLLGVIPKPVPDGPLTSVGFAGPNCEYLYATCRDKLYRRKTAARGVVFFEAPVEGKQ